MQITLGQMLRDMQAQYLREEEHDKEALRLRELLRKENFEFVPYR